MEKKKHKEGKCKCKKQKHTCTMKGCDNHVYFGPNIKRYLGVCKEHFDKFPNL